MKINLFLFLYFQAIGITQAGRPEDKLELAFRLYDIDRNGQIEEREMIEIIKVSKRANDQCIVRRPLCVQSIVQSSYKCALGGPTSCPGIVD